MIVDAQRVLPPLLCSFALVYSAWAFGCTEPWAVAGLEILVAVAMVLTLAGRAWGRGSGADQPTSWQASWGVPLGLLLVLVILQAANPSHTYSSADHGLTEISHVSFLPRSVDASTTLRAMLKLVAYAGLFWLARVSAGRGRERRVLLLLVLAGGFVMSVLAILQRVGPAGTVLYPRAGAFANENNLAAYMNLLIPVTLACARRARVEADATGAASHAGYLFNAVAGFMAVAVLMSRSVAGTVVCVGLITAWLLTELWQARGKDRSEGLFLQVALPVVFIVAGLFLAVQRRPGGFGLTSESLRSGLGARFDVARATLRMLAERPFFGIGAGTFSLAFPYYQADIPGFYRYAHNDWIQYLSELGAVGFGLVMLFGTGMLARAGKRDTNGLRRENETLHPDRFENRAILLALLGLGVHATVDFPLHVPAVTATASAWIGVVAATRRHSLARVISGSVRS